MAGSDDGKVNFDLQSDVIISEDRDLNVENDAITNVHHCNELSIEERDLNEENDEVTNVHHSAELSSIDHHLVPDNDEHVCSKGISLF